jgi:dienelactone hydrolase
MTDIQVLSKNVDHIPVIWVEPENFTAPAYLVIWIDGLTGNKERMQPYLTTLAASGFVAVSFDAFQHGERGAERPEQFISRIAGNYRRHYWPILGQTILDATRIIDWATANLKVYSDTLMGGISMGGDVAVATARIDRRVRCVAAMLATPDWLRPGMKDFADPSIEFAQGEADTYAKFFYDRFNPLTHLESFSHLPEITFECGAQDTLVPPDGALRFQEALNGMYKQAANRLRVNLHENVGHDPTIPQMWQNCLSWFTRYRERLRSGKGEKQMDY